MNIPVVCSLQDEDVWVDVMSDKYREEVWQRMSERGREIDAFIAVSDFYATEMKQRMYIPENLLHTVHLGVDSADYHPLPIGEKAPVIGYLSRSCKENGLEVLVDAFILLKKDPAFDAVKLKITGGKTDDDNAYIKEQVNKIRVAGIENSVIWADEYEGNTRQSFFDTVTLLSVPVLIGEAFGLYQLEAMASGIPMVQPALGAFPEVIGISGGGITYSPNEGAVLAEKLRTLLMDKPRLQQMSEAAISGVQQHFDVHKQAQKMVAVYEKALEVYQHKKEEK